MSGAIVPSRSLDDDDLIDEAHDGRRCERDDGEAAAARLLLLKEAQEAQEEVRNKVKPVRWEVFWQVVIEGESDERNGRRPRTEIRHGVCRRPIMWRNCSARKADGAAHLGLRMIRTSGED